MDVLFHRFSAPLCDESFDLPEAGIFERELATRSAMVGAVEATVEQQQDLRLRGVRLSIQPKPDKQCIWVVSIILVHPHAEHKVLLLKSSYSTRIELVRKPELYGLTDVATVPSQANPVDE